MKRNVKILLLCGALVVVIAAAVALMQLRREPEQTDGTTYSHTDATVHSESVAVTDTQTEAPTTDAVGESNVQTTAPQGDTAVIYASRDGGPEAKKSYTYTRSDAREIRQKDEADRTHDEQFCVEIERICERYSAIGLSLVVFKGEEELYSQVHGYADTARGIPVDDETKFRVASMSKFATGALVMSLVSEGKATIDCDISDYAGVRIRSPYYDDTVITPRLIMNHSSAIVDGDWAFVEGGTLPNMFREGRTSYFSGNKPGDVYIYSNFGASLLTCLIEKASGEHFINYAQTALMRPLGLDAAYTVAQLSDRNTVAEMYMHGELYKSQKTSSASIYGCLNTPIGKYIQLSFGNLMISPRDMSRIAMLMSGDGSYKGVRILSPDAVEEMNKTVEGSGSPWGLMQKIVVNDLIDGRTLHGHNGEAYGYIGCVYYDREDRTGFVYMSNGCSRAGGEHTFAITEAVARAVYGKYFDDGSNETQTTEQEQVAPN